MFEHHQMARDVAVEAVKAAPPVAVIAFNLTQWVGPVTFCYVVLQAAYLIWKWRREWKAKP